ncbi:hypothetical protein ACVW0P_002622 [Mucilaginibacter sp. UYNi724]
MSIPLIKSKVKNVLRLLSLLRLVLIAVCFVSCHKGFTNKADLITYINNPENGLQKLQQAGEIKAVLTYKPWQLIADKGKAGSEKAYSAHRYSNQLFFVLSLSANKKEVLRQLPFNQYSEMVQVLAFRMNDFIDVIPDSDKPVQPLNCIFQQTYGMGQANSILIAFDKKRLMAANNLRIHITEFGLYTGDLFFDIAVKDIKKLQDIVIN